ncbi:hypothetical protein AB4305_01040 [Nocardia sp. 2YAB30]
MAKTGRPKKDVLTVTEAERRELVLGARCTPGTSHSDDTQSGL